MQEQAATAHDVEVIDALRELGGIVSALADDLQKAHNFDQVSFAGSHALVALTEWLRPLETLITDDGCVVSRAT